jgi:hypothetical protein
MDSSARRFVSRAPRYVLRPDDRHVMRFGLEHTQGKGGIEETLLLNLSESGIAFLVNRGVEPRIGDRIKVEIPVPQGDRIAWWGHVVRTSLYDPQGWFQRDRFKGEAKVLVALRFEELPEPHTRAIRRGLNRSFMKAVRDQQFRSWQYYQTLLVENFWQAMLYVALTSLLVGFIYWFTLPSSNYDAKRGAPWGERFKF